MKKVLFVATVVKTHIMEFHIPYLKMFKEMGWETAVAARNDYENPADCVIPYCDIYYNIPFERNPLKPGNLKAYKELKHIIDEGEYDIVHCHTPVGAMLTRLAAKQARRKGTKVFYTAHGFHFYKGAPAINWILYYPVEKWLSRYTDVLITINKEDYERAKTFKASKVCYVPGVGIDLKKFNEGYVNKEQKRREIGVSANDFVLLSVGELIPRKNHEVVIRALSVLKQLDKLIHIEYVICGRGAYEIDLKKLAEELDVADHVHFLGYRNDISEICNCADLFVFMSHQEGLPVALMEAMACGLPAVCSNIRGNTDLIEDGVTGLLANNTPEEVAESISKMKSDTALRNRMASVALQKIKQFDLSSVEDEMSKIYEGGVRNLALQGVYKGQRIRKELGIPLDAKVVLSVGEVNKNKNHKVGIEALAKLRDKNTYYVICGRGPMMEAHKELAQSMLVSMAPGFQQRKDRVLHLLGRIAGREEPLHVRLIQEKLLTLIGLLLGEQGMQVVLRQCAALAHLFKTAGLHQRRRGLAKFHLGLQPPLVLRRHVGDLYRGVERHSGFVDHLQNGGDEVGQADVALYCPRTI